MSNNKRQQDQIEAIKARVGGFKPAPPPPTSDLPTAATPPAPPAPDRQDQAIGHFLGRVEHLIANRSVEHLPIGYIAPDLRPEMRQPRMLPLPEELIANGTVPPFYQELVNELRILGASLQERQMQPIVVYPGTSDSYPAARYLLLVGQRRWTAAHIVGMPTIEAVVIDPPTPLERLRLQYRENEDREDFSDMERAWTLQKLRQAMGGEEVPISEVIGLLGIKRSRAYQLLRLLAFPSEQQRTIALLRLQERQMLSLTDALHQEKIGTNQAYGILQRLSEIAAERAMESTTQAHIETTQGSDSPRRIGIDAPTVARLVARELARETPATHESSPRWYTLLYQSISSATRSLRRALKRAESLSPQESVELRAELLSLQNQLQRLLERIEPASPNPPTNDG